MMILITMQHNVKGVDSDEEEKIRLYTNSLGHTNSIHLQLRKVMIN
jgi:hypothetical protein